MAVEEKTIYNNDDNVTLNVDGEVDIENSGRNLAVRGSSGNDSIYVSKGYPDAEVSASVDAGGGNDVVAIYGDSAFDLLFSTVRGGKGNDDLFANQGNYLWQYADGDGNDSIYTYFSHNLIQLTAGSIASASLDGNYFDFKIGSGSLKFRSNETNVAVKDSSGKISGWYDTRFIDGYYSDEELLAGESDVIKIEDRLIIFDALLLNGVSNTVLTADAAYSDGYSSGVYMYKLNNYAENVTIRDGSADNLQGIFNYGANVSINVDSVGGAADNNELYEIYNYGSHVTINAAANDNDEEHLFVRNCFANDVLINFDGTVYNNGSDVTMRGGEGDDYVLLDGKNQLVQYAEGGGNDVLINYAPTDDATIHVTRGSIDSVSLDGDDYVLKIGSGSLRLADGFSPTVRDAEDRLFTLRAAGESVSLLPAGIDLDASVEGLLVNLNSNTILSADSSLSSIINYGTNVTIGGYINNVRVTLNGSAQVLDSSSNRAGDVTVYGVSSDDTIRLRNAFWTDDYSFERRISVEGSDIRFKNWSDAFTLIGAAGIPLNFAAEGSEARLLFSTRESNQLIEGSSDIDSIIGAASNSTINADGSAVENKGTNVLVNGSSANEIVRNFGSGTTIAASGGNDYIRNEGARVSIAASNGNDFIFDDGYMTTINAGRGDDTIRFSNWTSDKVVEYASSDGNDSVYGFARLSDFGEEMSSTLRITEGSLDKASADGLDAVLKIGSGSIRLTNAAGRTINLINADGSSATTVVGNIIEGTEDDDTLTSSQNGTIVRPGLGNDVVSLKGSKQIVDHAGGHDTIFGIKDGDTIRCTDFIVASSIDGSDIIINDDYRKAHSLTLKNAIDKKFTLIDFEGNYLCVPPAGTSLPAYNEISGICNYFDNVLIDAGTRFFPDEDKMFWGDAENVTVNFGGSININNGGSTFVNAGKDDNWIYYSMEETSERHLFQAATISGGKGNDTINIMDDRHAPVLFRYANGDGNDRIEWYGFNDLIQLTSGSVSEVSINPGEYAIELQIGSGSITLAEMYHDFPIAVKDADGSISAWVPQYDEDDDTERMVKINGNLFSHSIEDGWIFMNGISNTVLSGDQIRYNFGSNVTFDDHSGTYYGYFKNYGSNVSISVGDFNEEYEIYNYGSHVTIDVDDNDDNSIVRNYFNSDVVINADAEIYNTGSNVTIGGGAHDNIIHLGGGNQVVRYSEGGGNDTVYGFDASDRLRLDGEYETLASGANVIVSVGSGSLTLADAFNRSINIVDNDMIDADSLSAGIEYNPKKPSTITVKNPFTGVVDAKNFSDKVTLIDGSSDTLPLILKGGDKASVLRAGDGGSTLIGGKKDDKLYGGEGADVFAYALGNGKDVLNDVDADDVISIAGATREQLSFVDKKETVTITFKSDSTSKLTVNKINSVDPITLALDDGEYVYGQLPTGANYDDEKKKTAIKVDADAADGVLVDANEIVSTAKTLDGSAASGSVQLVGNGGANVLIAGDHDSTLDGGAGSDKLYGSKGADTFIFSAGSDQIYNFDGAQGDYIFVNGVSSIDPKKIVESANKVTATIGKNKIVLENPNGEINFVSDSGATLHSVGINLPSGVSYNKTKTSLTVDSSSTVEAIDLNAGYASTVKEINAASIGGAIELIGNAQPNVLRAGNHDSTLDGGEGNDKLYGGKGADTFIYSAGSDVIYNFDGNQGDLLLFNGVNEIDSAKVVESANKVTVTIGKNKIVLDNPNGKINLVNDSGATLHSVGVNLPSGVSYNKTKTSLTVDSSSTVEAIDLNEGYASTIKEINAASIGGAINLIGNAQPNVLRAGNHDSTLDGGYDSTKNKVTADKLYGGSGADVFVWDAMTGGGDQIYNYDQAQGDIVSVRGDVTIDKTDFKASGNKVVLSAGSGKLTLNDVKDKPIIVVCGADTITYGSLPGGISYNDLNKKTALKISDPFNGTLDASDYASTVVTLDASTNSSEIALIGSKKANVFKGGTGSTTVYGSAAVDKFFAGSGSDTFVYSLGGGKDQISGFDPTSDSIKVIGSDPISATDFSESGSNITLKLDGGSITLKDAPRGTYTVDFDGGSVTYKTLPSNTTYNAKKQLLTLGNNFEGTLDASTIGLPIKEINGSASTAALDLRADSNATKLTASKGGSTLTGGAGDDTLIGGKGEDVFVASAGDDQITNYTSGKDSIEIVGALSSGKLSGTKDVELKTTLGTITIKGVVNKEISIVESGVETKYKFTKTNNDLAKARVETSSELASSIEDYWFEQTIETDPIEKIIPIENISVDLIENETSDPFRKLELDRITSARSDRK